MPEGFERCRRNGGRIRTVSGPDKHWGLGSGEYMYVCWINSEPYRGEIHKKQKQSESESPKGAG